MGIVYEAEDLRLRRRVALKLLHHSLRRDGDAVQRFRLEAEAVARLNHPHICPVFDAGAAEHCPYLAMALIEGASLETRLGETKKGFPVPLAARMVLTVARAVQHAHERGILHRDLKPSNILLDSDGQPFVTDFGIAKVLGWEDGITLSRVVLGSPNYIAPEQAAGASRDLTTAADIYSLGAILYELLAGRPPFVAESPLATLRLVMEVEPASLRSLAPGVPRDLETICRQCLRKEPERRYDSAAALAEDLDRFLAGRPIHARPVALWERTLLWARRHPRSAAVSAVAAISLMAGTSAATWGWREAESGRRQAVDAASARQATAYRLQYKLGDQKLESGDLSGGIAQLTDLLRHDPNDRVAAQRLYSVLSHHPFPTPIGEPLHAGSFATAGDYSPDGTRFLTSAGDSLVQVRWTATGEPSYPPLPHERQVQAARFEQDGAAILSYSLHGDVWIWDSATGRRRAGPLVHDGAISAAALDPTGTVLAVGLESGRISLWNIGANNRIADSPAHSRMIKPDGLAFSPDGQWLASGSYDQFVRIVEARTGRLLGEPIRHPREVFGVFVSPDGRQVIAGCHDGLIYVTDLATRRLARPPFGHDRHFSSIALSTDGRLLAGGFLDNSVRVWSLETGLPYCVPLMHPARAVHLCFSPDAETLATAGRDGSARVWDLARGRLRAAPIKVGLRLPRVSLHPSGGEILTPSSVGTFRWRLSGILGQTQTLRHSNEIRQAEFTADGRFIATLSDDKTARVWDARTGVPVTGSLPLDSEGQMFCFSPDSRWLVVVSRGVRVHVFETATGVERPTPIQQGDRLYSADFSPDGRRLVTGGADHRAALWDFESGRLIQNAMTNQGVIRHVSFSPDGRRIGTVCYGWTARVWDTETGQPVTPILRHAWEVRTIRFSPDGRTVVTAAYDNRAYLWDATTGRLLREFPHADGVEMAEFSPDGRKIVTAGFDNLARIWDVRTGKPIGAPLQHQAVVGRARFSPDGRRIVTGAEDRTGRVWDANTGEPVTEPLRHLDILLDARFSPDGQRVVTTSRDGTARIWECPEPSLPLPAWWLAVAESLGGSRINPDGLLEVIDWQAQKGRWTPTNDLSQTNIYTDWARRFFNPPPVRTERH